MSEQYKVEALPRWWWLNPWRHAMALHRLCIEYDNGFRAAVAKQKQTEKLLNDVVAQWRKDQHELYELKKR